jgi:hypothetical protein
LNGSARCSLKTEDGELTRIRRRARGESSLGCGSGCSAEGLVAPAEALVAPEEDLLAPAGDRPLSRRVRPLGVGCRLVGVGGRLLRDPSVRSCHGPAPSPLESFAPPLVGRLRPFARLLPRPAALVEVEHACGRIRPPDSGAGMSAPAVDLSGRPSIRRLRSPIRRLGSRVVVCASDPSSPASDSSASMLDAPPRAVKPAPGSSNWPARPRRNRSYHRSAAVPRLRHWRRLSSLAALGMTDATSFRRFPMSPPCSLRDSETLGVRSR